MAPILAPNSSIQNSLIQNLRIPQFRDNPPFPILMQQTAIDDVSRELLYL